KPSPTYEPASAGTRLAPSYPASPAVWPVAIEPTRIQLVTARNAVATTTTTYRLRGRPAATPGEMPRKHERANSSASPEPTTPPLPTVLGLKDCGGSADSPCSASTAPSNRTRASTSSPTSTATARGGTTVD